MIVWESSEITSSLTTFVCIIGLTEGEEREQVIEDLFEEMVSG